MPEEGELPLEHLQEEIKDRVEEELEKEKEGKGRGRLSRARYIQLLAGTTAIFAVLAAIASLASGNYANEALFKANQSVLAQSRAADLFAEYQADGLKSLSYANQATILQQTNGAGQALQDAQANAKRESDKRPPLLTQAQGFEREAADRERESSEQLEHHHRFAFSVTLFQVAIGLGALAVLVNIQPVWWLSILAGLGGLVLLIAGFAPIHESQPATGTLQSSLRPVAESRPSLAAPLRGFVGPPRS